MHVECFAAAGISVKPRIVCLACLACCFLSCCFVLPVFTIVYQVLRDDYIGMVVLAAVGIAATVSLHLSCKQYNRPTTYGVWLFPYVPALSVGLNCFLLGQLKTAAYERFGIWTAFVTRECLWRNM